MILAYSYRLMGAACFVALFANVYKHGWHPFNILVGAFCTVLIFSLGVSPNQRTIGWEVRYVVAAVTFVGLAAFRFLR